MKFQDFFLLCKIYQLVWRQLDYRKLGLWETRLLRPLCHKTEKLSFMCDTLIWKICISAYIEFYTYLDWRENLYFNLQTFRTSVQVEINKVLHATVVEGRHLVAGFENNPAGGSRFERVGSQNFLGNRQISCETSATSSTCFWDPRAPLGPKRPKRPT